MKKILTTLLLLSILTAGVVMAAPKKKPFTLTSQTVHEGMTLTDEQVFNGFGCSGKNIAPDFQWSNKPEGTKSFAFVMHDPDAPIEGGWYHWILVNIPSVKMGFLKNELQARPVVETLTSFGNFGYGGPCPPVGHGKHRYIFTVYALSIPGIPAREDAPINYIMANIEEYTIDKASITTYYERK